MKGRNLEAGTETETIEEDSFTQTFFYATWDHLPMGGTTHSVLGLPTSILFVLHLSMGNLIEACSLLSFPLPRYG